MATYLDHASATPWHPRALLAHQRVAEQFWADPTRGFQGARDASDLLERARGAVAEQIGARPDGVIFTSGGTEAIHLAVRGTAQTNRTRPRRIISTAVEHSAVLAAADDAARLHDHEHIVVGVDADGRVDLDQLHAALADGAALVNVQHANHEVGTLQPLAEAVSMSKEAGALVHVDACQTVGRLAVDMTEMGADYLSLSAAKFGAGRGVGALLCSPAARLSAIQTGDEREKRRRAGLQDLPGIAALAETLATLWPNKPGEAATARAATDVVRRHLRTAVPSAVEDVEVHGAHDDAAPHIVALSALYVEGQALVAALDRAGWAVHSGSSCATTSGEPSHVLVAMGALTHGHVRVSLDHTVTTEDVDRFVVDLARVVEEERTRVGM